MNLRNLAFAVSAGAILASAGAFASPTEDLYRDCKSVKMVTGKKQMMVTLCEKSVSVNTQKGTASSATEETKWLRGSGKNDL